jgi:ABC-type multidrug transport system ATPase subunit
VAIARALLHDPPVLLLDEPDTGLDLAAFGPLEELTTSGERTVVLTTHNLATGLRLGSRVAILSAGRVVHQQASVSPADAPALAELLERLGRG